MMRQNIASGLTHDNSQKMYLHQAATPSLLQNNPFSKKHFENPNTFLLNAPGLGTPCSPKQSSISKDHVSEKNLLNSSIISSVNTQSINSDTMLFDKSSVETALNNMNTPESPRKEPEMETSDEEMSCSDESEESPMEVSFEDDDDSFIVFEAEPDLSKSKEIPIDEFIDEDNSFVVLEAEAGPSKSKEIPIEEFIDEDDSFIVFETETGSSNGRESPIIEFIDEDDSDVENGVDEDAESDTESLDDFVVFADHEPEEIPAVKEQKPNNGKKVRNFTVYNILYLYLLVFVILW